MWGTLLAAAVGIKVCVLVMSFYGNLEHQVPDLDGEVEGRAVCLMHPPQALVFGGKGAG